jgi:4'-phosphopantetheinyl transferase
MAVAVTSRGQVGIDVERCRPRNIEAIGEHWLSPHEQRWLAEVPRRDRQSAFARIWCRKEAYVKALGVGIDGGFADFSVVWPGHADGRVRRDGGRVDPAWTLRDLDMPSGYAGALAVPVGVETVELSEWRGSR